MKAVSSLAGQAVALNNIARTYEYMNNLGKAAESLEAVSDKGQNKFIISEVVHLTP